MSKLPSDSTRRSDTDESREAVKPAFRVPRTGAPRSDAASIDAERADLQLLSKHLRSIGLFDEEFYKNAYPDLVTFGRDPFLHFYLQGYLEGRRPNPMFDPAWYLATYPEARSSRQQPLLHYVRSGERDGYRPGPLFDPAWYRQTYGVAVSDNVLAHYLRHRFGPFSPIPEFDAAYYLDTYRDVAEAGFDPFEHFNRYGFREGRNPSRVFDTKFYLQRYLRGETTHNPLLHYLAHRHESGVFPHPPENEATIPSQIKRFTKPGPAFEEQRPLASSVGPRAKVLANYLTQFHSFPENDRWWGTGFTEWTNIARGVPRFMDHYQPRIPRDLGFYSLDSVDIMQRQVAMAKAAGIHGFVFYYYAFNGRRLMEKPLDQFLDRGDIDMPFCLMWANENWTRRWDGRDDDVLISQDYRPEDDGPLVADFARHFADPRYLRLQGRPLLMIYRPGLIPDAARVIAGWRAMFRDRHGEDPVIIMGQSFDDADPRPFGLDGAVEFPPHKLTTRLREVNSQVQCLDDTFAGEVYRYDDVVRCSLDEAPPPFPLIKTAAPSWDNDSRRQGKGLVIHGSTPAAYEAWLAALVERAQRELFFGEPIVCVNAWNEWGEGAYLEPDVHFGSAYLNATGRAVTGRTSGITQSRSWRVGMRPKETVL